MTVASTFELQAEMAYRQDRMRNSVRRHTRRRHRRQRNDEVFPSGDAQS